MQPERGSAEGPPGEGGRQQEAARPQVSVSVLRGGRKERRNWETSGSERSLAGSSGGRREEKLKRDYFDIIEHQGAIFPTIII